MTKLSTKQFQVLRTLRIKNSGNIVGKGENAGDQRFFFPPQCFFFPFTDTNFFTCSIFNSLPHNAPLRYIAEEKIMRKGEIACKSNFSFSHSVFYPIGTYFSFQMHFKMSSTICFDLDQSNILSFGNGLICPLQNSEKCSQSGPV